MTADRKNNNEAKTAYLVTEDLSLVVCRWCEMQCPKIPTTKLKESNLFGDLLSRLADALRDYSFDAQQIEVITLQRSIFDDLLKKRDLVSDDRGRIDRKKKPTEFWVALDNVYPTPLLDTDPAKYNMSITRYVDSNGKPFEGEEGHGSRPEDGETNLHHQVRECVNKLEDAEKKYKKDLPIILVDDGTFTGETIFQVLTEFAKQDVIINSVRLGVAKSQGIDLIASWTPPPVSSGAKRVLDGVYFIGASKLCPPLKDWICERDFFPGVLYAGRVVARREDDDTVRPLRVGPKKIPVRSQYLYGWGNPTKWASIEEDAQRSFTLAALGLSIELWSELEALARRTIKVQDLPAVPAKLFDKEKPEMNRILKKSWLQVLKDEHKKLERSL
jgi:hypothetical protein